MDWKTIYNHPNVIGVCRDLGGSEWEDIRNDVFVKLVSMSEDERNEIKNMVAYAVRLCANRARDFHKKRKPLYIDPMEMEVPQLETEGTNILGKLEADFFSGKLRMTAARVFVYSNQYGSIRAFHKVLKRKGLPITYNVLRQLYNDYRVYLKDHIRNS